MRFWDTVYFGKFCGGTGDCEYSDEENVLGNIVQKCSPPDMSGEQSEFLTLNTTSMCGS